MPSAANANQYIVSLHKKEPVQPPFIIVSQQDFGDAFKKIKEICPQGNMGALGLGIYLAQNKGDFDLNLSPAAFTNLSSYSRNNFYKSKEILEKTGHLVRRDNVDNMYDFYTKLWNEDEIDLDELSFVEALQLDGAQMANVYYRLQEMSVEDISDDMAEFYDFYQNNIEGEQ